ncbi:hypothetical protein FG386_003126 [Cryptosporidium ryanae]|uniref:uncharacterized protein n=1 Tax=Cryptosporidium ryanae TaxID=515981 RepID=UPI00351A9CA9|nr:hypothetical protein FG386_003126 [Cryptosporidium ryanae]
MRIQKLLILLTFVSINVRFIHSKSSSSQAIEGSLSKNGLTQEEDLRAGTVENSNMDNKQEDGTNGNSQEEEAEGEEQSSSEVLGMFKSSDFDSGAESREDAVYDSQQEVMVIDVKNETSTDDKVESPQKLTADIMEEEPPKLESIEVLMGRNSGESLNQIGVIENTTGITPSAEQTHGYLGDNVGNENGSAENPSHNESNAEPLSLASQENLIKESNYEKHEHLNVGYSKEANKNVTSVPLEEKGVESNIHSGLSPEFDFPYFEDNNSSLPNLEWEKQQGNTGVEGDYGVDNRENKDIDFSDFRSDMESQTENFEPISGDESKATASFSVEGQPSRKPTHDSEIGQIKDAVGFVGKTALEKRRKGPIGRGRVSRRVVRRIFNKKGAWLFAREISKMKPQLKKKFMQEILKNMEFSDIELLIGLAMEEKFMRSEENKLKQAFQSNIPAQPLLGKRWIEREKSKGSKE